LIEDSYRRFIKLKVIFLFVTTSNMSIVVGKMENKTNPFGSIYEKLDIMEEKKVVDLDILNDFKKLKDEFSTFEEECTKKSELSTEDAFLLYHASRSSRMILEKISEKFRDAEEGLWKPVESPSEAPAQQPSSSPPSLQRDCTWP
jgi:hypothetical protein